MMPALSPVEEGDADHAAAEAALPGRVASALLTRTRKTVVLALAASALLSGHTHLGRLGQDYLGSVAHGEGAAKANASRRKSVEKTLRFVSGGETGTLLSLGFWENVGWLHGWYAQSSGSGLRAVLQATMSFKDEAMAVTALAVLRDTRCGLVDALAAVVPAAVVPE